MASHPANSPGSWRSSLLSSAEAALPGAGAGAAMGALAQLLYRFPSDLEPAALAALVGDVGRGALLGAGVWAGVAVALLAGWRWALRGGTALARHGRWALAAVALTAVVLVGLFAAGRFGLGFSRDFAILHALYFAGPGSCGAWLMGGLALARARDGSAPG